MNNNDTSRTDDQRAIQNSFISFIGYKFKDKFRIAAEYNYQKQYHNLKDTDLFGYSFYGTYIFSEKFEVFGRVDILNSNKLDEEVENWNYKKDGTGFLGGLQYKPIKEVKLALNYRNWQYNKPNEGEIIIPKSFIYISLEFVF
jgi:opacity protein-like surface antigen